LSRFPFVMIHTRLNCHPERCVLLRSRRSTESKDPYNRTAPPFSRKFSVPFPVKRQSLTLCSVNADRDPSTWQVDSPANPLLCSEYMASLSTINCHPERSALLRLRRSTESKDPDNRTAPPFSRKFSVPFPNKSLPPIIPYRCLLRHYGVESAVLSQQDFPEHAVLPQLNGLQPHQFQKRQKHTDQCLS
jgi:hypothetical protein